MYGYVLPDKSNIKNEEFVLFGAFYCGICKAIGRSFNQITRLTTNYDIAFYAALISDQTNFEVEIGSERCIGNPFKKRAIIKKNELLRRIADVNMIMTFYKVIDGQNDRDGHFKSLTKRILRKHYQRAAAREPMIDQITAEMFEALNQAEKRNESRIDIVSDCFATMLKRYTQALTADGINGQGKAGGNNELCSLMYNIGKFVYLADALDDIQDDHKKNRYNPFLAAFGAEKFVSRKEFIFLHKDEIQFIFSCCINRAIECFNSMDFNQSYGLLQNIIYYGLRLKAKELIESDRKLKRPKI